MKLILENVIQDQVRRDLASHRAFGYLPRPRTTVLAHGTFDLLHLGHIRHLQEAAKEGDRLVVSVTDDRFVAKGVGRPHFTLAERVEALRALSCVHDVVVSESADAADVIESIRPAVYVKGIDYGAIDQHDKALMRERDAVERVGGRLHITGAPKFSSSWLINAEKLPEPARAYLEVARQTDMAARIRDGFAAADKLRIAFVGETIIDEYRYLKPLGRPAKEFILAGVETGREQFHGGAWAASRHAQWAHAALISPLGPSGLITKTRFVQAETNHKVFETYSTPQISLDEDERAAFHVNLIDKVAQYDAVIVFDFGHGLMGPQERHFVEGAKFLAVNAQTNAGNFGFNPVTRYTRADYLCVDDPEARLATGMREEPIEEVIRFGLAARINARRFAVTNGRHGAVAFDRQGGGERVVTTPAFALGGVDTMGAGDAFLAVSGPLLAAGLDMEAAVFAGAVAGALKVSIVGHRRHVGRDELVQTIEALLK